MIQMKDKKSNSESNVTFSSNPRIGLLSDVGQKRPVDEDSILAVESVSAFKSKMDSKFLLVIADGMGGHSKGEVASKIAVDAIAEKLFPKLLFENNYAEEIKNAIDVANSRILAYTDENRDAHGMGTTIVCAVVDGKNVHLANVGDSRAYVISKEEIRRVTKDHSLVQELVDKGEITQKEAATHPKKNVILRAVGIYSDVDIDTMKLTLSDDEYLLLCCDGQLIHVEDEELQEIIVKADSVQDACNKLVDVANKRGGEDNISVVLLGPASGRN